MKKYNCPLSLKCFTSNELNCKLSNPSNHITVYIKYIFLDEIVTFHYFFFFPVSNRSIFVLAPFDRTIENTPTHSYP